MYAFQLDSPVRVRHTKQSSFGRMMACISNLLKKHTTHYIAIVKIGNIVLADTHNDFSGELIPEIEYVAEPLGIDFIATSFNGGYVGYITKDKWYDLHEYETFIMNWFGPYNGAYFVEIIQRLIQLSS